MILMIDNYDSFTFNIVQYMSELGETPKVIRNDEMTIEEALALKPAGVVISPGPCDPSKAGISCQAIRRFSDIGVPVFGVCLGHQSFAVEFGATVSHAPYLMHGKVSSITHDGTGLFKGIPSPYDVVRYHSLTVLPETLNDEFVVTSKTDDDIIMGLRHKTRCIHTVQFHPESILSQHGHTLIQNFLDMCK